MPTRKRSRSVASRIIYLVHAKVGHLGIFVSSSVSRRRLRTGISSLSVIDGEAVVLCVDGIADFKALHSRRHDGEVQLLRLRYPRARR